MPLASWPPETQRLLGGGTDGVPFNCIAGRFDVSGGVASLRRLVVDTPRAVLVGGGYVQLRTEGWEFILAPEARDNQNAALASPLRLKGGSGRPTTGALEPALARLIVAGRHRSQPGGADQPRIAPGRRQCLRRGGAAGRSAAAGTARPAADAHCGRCAPALGTPSESEPVCETAERPR